MNLEKNQGIKVLRSGASWHGGSRVWSLPQSQPDGSVTPGEWTPAVMPRLCSSGWHLTTEPARWWGAEGDVRAYLAEWDGAVARVEGEDKFAVERCRLLRELTPDELATCGVFLSGEHEVRAGIAWASGSSTVTASGSSTVTASGSSTVTAYGSSTVTAYGSSTVTASGSPKVTASGSSTVTAYDSSTVTASGSSTVTAYGSSTVTAYDSSTVTAYGSSTVRAYGSSTVTASGSSTVRAYGSSTVRAYGSSKTHAAGRSVATAWSGTAVVTRADEGCIVDRRGGASETYLKRKGLDGWRYTDGSWAQRKPRTTEGWR